MEKKMTKSLLEQEVVSITQQLIQIDTTNYGDGTGPGEALCSEYISSILKEVGIDSRIYEAGKNRHNVIARIEGKDSSRGALVIDGHMDVVPAVGDWQHPAFSGALVDDVVWGRGAVDMKSALGITLATVRNWQREKYQPNRDVVLVFTADEEAGSNFGSHWLVDNAPTEFQGVTEAVGEVGGFSYTLKDDLRLYLIEAAQKGIAWLEIHAKGRAGHGSMISNDNAVTELSAAMARIGNHTWPIRLTDTVSVLLQEVSEITGIPLDEQNPDAVIAQLGNLAKMVGATVRHTANPTMLKAGYKTNVIPETAMGVVDGRFLPGYRDEFLAEMSRLVGPNLEIRPQQIENGLETSFDGDLVEAMKTSLIEHDPCARIVPYTLSGGTDAKALDRLNIRCFGFAPLKLPPTLDFSALFHGVDERVPVESLEFGAKVFDSFLKRA
jgi:acetylornithine deacetylase/succinyl-diaminopimelate desuccinylase-like protein